MSHLGMPCTPPDPCCPDTDPSHSRHTTADPSQTGSCRVGTPRMVSRHCCPVHCRRHTDRQHKQHIHRLPMHQPRRVCLMRTQHTQSQQCCRHRSDQRHTVYMMWTAERSSIRRGTSCTVLMAHRRCTLQLHSRCTILTCVYCAVRECTVCRLCLG